MPIVMTHSVVTPTISVGGYTAQGVTFDGTNDYLLASGAGPLTGEINTRKVIVSFWFKMNGGDGSYQILFEDSASTGKGLQVGRDNANKWFVTGYDSGAAGVLNGVTAASYTSASGAWHHFLMSSDGDGTGPAVYVDDVSDVGGATGYSGGIDINCAEATGTRSICNRTTGSLLVNADIADLYINTTEYLNFAVTGNRRLFITAGLAPVDLGATGSTPTGTAPLIFLHGAVASWHTNDGTGGGFNLTGALAASPTNPP